MKEKAFLTDEINLKELFQTLWNYKYFIIIFTTLTIAFSLIYVLSKPNIYAAEIILQPTEQKGQTSLGGLAGLAGIAGINLGSNSSTSSLTLLELQKDYELNKKIILKYNLIEKLTAKNLSQLVFAFNNPTVYNILNPKENKKDTTRSEEDLIYLTYRQLKDIVSLTKNKINGLITLKVTHENRFLAKELSDIYLKELTNHLRLLEMKDIESQIRFYNHEIENTTNLDLKEQLSQLTSSLVQKKVLAEVNPYYIVKIIVPSSVAHIQNKVAPKRFIILAINSIVGFIISLMLVLLFNALKQKKGH